MFFTIDRPNGFTIELSSETPSTCRPCIGNTCGAYSIFSLAILVLQIGKVKSSFCCITGSEFYSKPPGLCSRFCCYNDNAILCSKTIQGCCRSSLQNGH